MLDCYTRQFRPPEATPEQDCHHRVVADPPNARSVKHREQPLALFRREPVSEPHSMLLPARVKYFETPSMGVY
jgi:hypothetical protein